MRRYVAFGCVALACASAGSAQDLDTAKKQADLDLVRANIAKVRAEADSAPLAPLKGLGATGSATVTGGEKTAEALILNRAVTDGLAVKLVDAVVASGIAPADTIKPWIIIGGEPPSFAAWQAFEADRITVSNDLVDTTARWSKTPKASIQGFFAGPIAGAIAIVGAVAPLLKTDTVITGGERKLSDEQLLFAVQNALKRRGFGTDDAAFVISDGIKDARALMQPADAAWKAAKQAFDDGASIAVGDAKASTALKAAAQELANALAAYDALYRNLATPTDGVMLATVIKQQKAQLADLANRPLVYVVATEAAFTTMTRKNFLSGISSTPAYLSSVAVIDYAIMAKPGSPLVRGSVECFARRREFDEIGTRSRTDTAPICS